MTQILYKDLELTLQTNGDCSTFTILGSPGSREIFEELILKLQRWQFVVDDEWQGDFIHFMALPVDDTDEGNQGKAERDRGVR